MVPEDVIKHRVAMFKLTCDVVSDVVTRVLFYFLVPSGHESWRTGVHNAA